MGLTTLEETYLNDHEKKYTEPQQKWLIAARQKYQSTFKASRTSVLMEFAELSQEEIDRKLQLEAAVTDIKGKVEEVKGLMKDNLEKVLKRGEKVEELIDQTQTLVVEAVTFNRRAKDLKSKNECCGCLGSIFNRLKRMSEDRSMAAKFAEQEAYAKASEETRLVIKSKYDSIGSSVPQCPT